MVSIQLVHRTVHPNRSITTLRDNSSRNVASNILESTSPEPPAAVGKATHSDSETRPEASPPQWAPQLNASYLTRGANGTWYFRMVVPAHLRAQNPDLPHEIRRSTKTAQKRLALAKAKQMCLEAHRQLIATTHVSDPEGNEVTAAKLAVDAQVEEGQLTHTTFQLEPNPECPDIFELERGLLANNLALVPWCHAAGQEQPLRIDRPNGRPRR